jgi:hypothetical protein
MNRFERFWRFARQGAFVKNERMKTAILFSYALISPMALMPADVLTRYPAIRAWVRGVESVVPMIDRVAAYGYPYPEKLSCFLAYAWCCIPVLLFLGYRMAEPYNKPFAWGSTARMFWCRWIGAQAFCWAMILGFWYWPNLLFSTAGMLDPITILNDKRRGLLSSTPSLILYTPLWIFAVANGVDALRCEFLNLLWRLGLISSYPSQPYNNSAEETEHV